MDRLIAEILVVVVVDVLGSESSGWATSAEILEVVVVVGDVEVAGIDVTECGIVADQRCFVVIVKVVPGDCDPI